MSEIDKNPYFAFIDESGVLENDPDQTLFALGFLLIKDTSEMVESLSQLKATARQNLNMKPGQSFEFKFSRITYRNIRYYEQLIDVIFSSSARVVIFSVDKSDPKIDINKYFKSTWDAHISYTKLVLRNRLRKKECIVIADYLQRPKKNPRRFEVEVSNLNSVVNATMLESHACILIQAIDVLTGCVCYYEKRMGRKSVSKTGEMKKRLAKYLSQKLGINSLGGEFKVNSPISFEVWKFKPK
ncbi:MAG: DUF3800 domain-containing protein [bacterium]